MPDDLRRNTARVHEKETGDIAMLPIKSFFLVLYELFIRKPNKPAKCPDFVPDLEPNEINEKRLWLEFHYQLPCYDKTELDAIDYYRRNPFDDPLA